MAVIDIHVHFGSPPDEASGCFWSEKFTRQPAFFAMLLLTRSLFKKVNFARVKKHLLGVIDGSRLVEKSVLLAMDMVYGEDGRPRPEDTHLHVPNSCVAGLARENPRILFGASIHPYRRDGLEELERCLEAGAVLCKWLPSSMRIDPGSGLCAPFYRALADRNLPLLCHAGPEYTIPAADEDFIEFNNPRHLRPALEAGVTVIVAHCSLPYFWFLDVDYQDDFEEFLKLFEEAESRGWKLYADVSALCTPLRLPYIDRVLEKVPQERLVFGSDYPIPLFEIMKKKTPGFFDWVRSVVKTLFMKNPLDRNYRVLRELGLTEEVFHKAEKIFSCVRR